MEKENDSFQRRVEVFLVTLQFQMINVVSIDVVSLNKNCSLYCSQVLPMSQSTEAILTSLISILPLWQNTWNGTHMQVATTVENQMMPCEDPCPSISIDMRCIKKKSKAPEESRKKES